MHDYVKRISIDKVMKDEDCCKELKDMGIEVRPTNFTGTTELMGCSASDKSRNLRITGEEMKKRLGC